MGRVCGKKCRNPRSAPALQTSQCQSADLGNLRESVCENAVTSCSASRRLRRRRCCWKQGHVRPSWLLSARRAKVLGRLCRSSLAETSKVRTPVDLQLSEWSRVTLAGCQSSTARMTETPISRRAYKAAIKWLFMGVGEIRKESVTAGD